MRPISVRTYLFVVLSVLTALPVLLLGRDGANRVAAEMRAWSDQALTTEAVEVKLELERELAARLHELKLLAAQVEATDGVRSQQATRMVQRHSAASGHFDEMYLADINGELVDRAKNEPSQLRSSPNYAEREYYLALIETGEATVSKVQLGRRRGVPSVQLVAPIRDAGGELEGFVEGSLSLDLAGTMLQRRARSVDGTRLVILDGSSRVVGDSRSSDGLLRDVADVAAFAPYSALSAAPRTAADEEARPVRAATATLDAPLSGWRAVVLESQAHIDVAAEAARARTWMGTLAALGLALLLSATVAHWAGRRLSGLASSVSAIGRGEFFRRPQPWRRFEPREIGVLVRELDAMVASLEKRHEDCEALVADRTQELASVNERLEMLVSALEKAGDGVEITDPRGRYVYVNPAIERITGYTRQELLGKSPKMLRTGLHDEAFYKRIERACEEGRVFHDSFAGRRKDGSHFDQEVTVWPVHDEQGTLTHVVGLRRDITERKKTEHALRVSERMASIGTLAAGVAHEINNPLTYLLLSLRQIQRQLFRNADSLPQEFTDTVGKASEYALEGAERVQAIVQDLRSFSRVDDVTVRFVDPNIVLDSALRMVGNDVRHRAKLDRTRGATPGVMANPARLSQVFLNLLVNALQALGDVVGERKNVICVRTGTTEDGNVFVTIADTGAGIAPEHLDRIFDPFFTTKAVGKGTGLGLSLCHSVVQGMGGKIEVSSQVGQGTSFRVILPAAVKSTQPVAATEPYRQKVAPASRVLVIDDDPAVADAVADALERHHVTVVNSAGEALESCQATSFDVLLCDVMMPGMSGTELFAELTRRAPRYSRRVIFMTGGTFSDSTRLLVESRSIPCLVKPLSTEELEAAIAERLEASRRSETEVGASAAS